MIRIDIKNKKSKIEEIYWDWFYRYHLERFLKILSEDIILQGLIFDSRELYLLWKVGLPKYKKYNYKILKDFFFSAPQTHFHYIEIMNGLHINNQSKEFFLNTYENFRNSQIPKIIDVLDIHSCPYCNKNFIDIYYKGNTSYPNRFNGDMDHYFVKKRYEYLALCLYNLIPSCKSCNREKGENQKGLRHFHPYMDDHTEYRFRTNFNLEVGEFDINYLYGLSENFDIEVFDCFDEVNANNIKCSIELFHLNDKYNNKNMKSLARNIIRKSYMYSHGYLKDFVNQFHDILSEKEMIETLFDYDDESFLNRPLSKFKYDLMKEFNII